MGFSKSLLQAKGLLICCSHCPLLTAINSKGVKIFCKSPPLSLMDNF